MTYSPWGRKQSNTTERPSVSPDSLHSLTHSLTQFWSLLKFTSSERLSLAIPSNTVHSCHTIPFLLSFSSEHLSLPDITLYNYLPSLKHKLREDSNFVLSTDIFSASEQTQKSITDVVSYSEITFHNSPGSLQSYITSKTKYLAGIFLFLSFNEISFLQHKILFKCTSQ